MNNKETRIYFYIGSLAYGGISYFLLHSLMWSLFFLLFISLMITKTLEHKSKASFNRQFLSTCIGLFVFGWAAVIVILIVKALILYVFREIT